MCLFCFHWIACASYNGEPSKLLSSCDNYEVCVVIEYTSACSAVCVCVCKEREREREREKERERERIINYYYV